MPETISAFSAAGIPRSLAQARATALGSLRYTLVLRIPRSPADPITGRVSIEFELRAAGRMPPLDFAPGLEQAISSVSIDGKPPGDGETAGDSITPGFEPGHGLLHLDYGDLDAGTHRLDIEFRSNGTGLRRREGLVYSLFVPAKAHTVFPCFDQPDLKARFSLELSVPADWQVLANTAEHDNLEDGEQRILKFSATGLLPTYLFAFIAGRARKLVREHNGRSFQVWLPSDAIDADAELDDIAQAHAAALDFLEDYTGIPYPYPQLGLALIPDFEFGGMEHPGAVYYRSDLLLNPASETQRLRRAHLIAHETAHMWFGNLVTMTWFDDVWLKEVFANHLADKITARLFPTIDHAFNSLLQHHPPACNIDRTAGTHPIRQSLERLADAGELYDAIIYHKAPIAIQQLEDRLGAAALQQGLCNYLQRFAHGNASWPDLLEILEHCAGTTLSGFNRDWINASGFPASASASASASGRYARQASSGNRSQYGAQLNEADRYDALQALKRRQLPLARASAWLALFEDMLAGGTTPAALLTAGIAALQAEPESLLIARLTTDICEIYWRYLADPERASAAPAVERILWSRCKADADAASWLAALSRVALTPESLAELRAIWQDGTFNGAELPLSLQTRLAIQLALANPSQADAVFAEQTSRIKSGSGHSTSDCERFALNCHAVSPDDEVRNACFRSLTERQYPDRWAIEAIGLLNHPLRAAQSIHYLEPGIAHARSLHQAGELFLPRQWLTQLFSGHNSEQAAAITEATLTAGTTADRFRQLLLQTADPVQRAVRIRRAATREQSAYP